MTEVEPVSEVGIQHEENQDTDTACKMMEEVALGTDLDDSCDSFDEHYDRPAERWAPLGAAQEPDEGTGAACSELSHMSETDRLRALEEEQDQLNTSLLALTSHFAQVQFRLKQIVDSDGTEKETLLIELEEFAFKGIPDVRGCKSQDAQILQEMSESEYNEKISQQRQKQQELIHQLKSQLEDLETYAYETGDSDLPTSKKMEKQDVIISQLRNKLDIDLENFDKLTTDDLRKVVDHAVGSIVNPAKVKAKMVEQLKTQITDLERFIEFLQGEATTPGPLGEKCNCEGTSTKSSVATKDGSHAKSHKSYVEQTLDIMKRTLTVLQIFAISQFGCGGRDFQKNLLKRTTKGNHWGDLRARLEVAVNRVVALHKHCEETQPDDTDYTSDSEDAPVILCNQQLTTAVRKELAVALKDLLQHGLMEVGQSSSLVPFGCFSGRSQATRAPKMMHAWDLFVRYYDMKHGKEYNETAQRKLTQSFGLEIVGGKPVTVKQTLLGALAEIQSTHVPLKRSEDSQFKAFVCYALNHKSLVKWMRLLLRAATIVDFYYQPWSYVVRTGFDDALVSLDRLTKLNFTLPVDLAVRPFTNIKDAF